MKRRLQIIVSASAASILACSALAQNTAIPKADGQNYTRERSADARRADRLNGAAKASDLIGMDVNNYQKEKLGKVEDLAVDVESGRIVQVILSTGGFIGIGDTLTAVPPGALHHDVANKVLHLDADLAKLKASPKFEMSKWSEYSDSDHLSQVYRHYGEEPAYTFVQRGDAVLEVQPKTGGDQFMIPASRLGQVQKASKLIGTSVKNLQDEKLGKVGNILLDLASGRVVAVIVSSGGFLGMGDELSAVPPSALHGSGDTSARRFEGNVEQGAAFQGQYMAGLQPSQLCRWSLSRVSGRAVFQH
jgi:sporulation protein YlmC with PRC-barrel domain